MLVSGIIEKRIPEILRAINFDALIKSRISETKDAAQRSIRTFYEVVKFCSGNRGFILKYDIGENHCIHMDGPGRGKGESS